MALHLISILDSRRGMFNGSVVVGVIFYVLLVDLDGKLLLLYCVAEDLFVGHEGGVAVATSGTSPTGSTTAPTPGAGHVMDFAHPKGFFYVHNF